MKAKPRPRSRIIGRPIPPSFGCAWYTPENYERMLQLLNFPPGMTRDYSRWLETAEGHELGLKRRRPLSIVARVNVEPDEFVSWCAARGIQPTSEAINGFVYYKVTDARQ